MIRVFLLAPLEQGGHFSQGRFISCTQVTREGQHALLAPAAFQVTLIQSNQYAMVSLVLRGWPALCPSNAFKILEAGGEF